MSRLRRALPATGQLLGVGVAATLWLGLASPGLQLLPGIDGLADDSIEISLQSAILGIDDGSGRPAEERARAAAAVLGLAYDRRLLAASFVTAAAADDGSGVVQLRTFAAQLAAPSPPVPRTDEAAAAPIADPVTPTAPAASPAAPPVAAPSPPVAALPAASPQPTKPTPAALPAPRVPRSEEPPALLRQTVAFATAPPAGAAVGGSYDVVAASSSGLPVRLSIDGDRAACRLTGATVSFRAVGTCVVEARQAGNDTYADAEARQSFEIARAGQTVAFSSTPPSAALVGGSYTVAAGASSGLPVVLSVAPTSRRVCELTGATVTFARAGTCTVEADQSGDASFLPAPTVRQSFAVGEPPVVLPEQTISFTTSPPAPARVGGTYAVAAVASSGLAVAFSVAPGSAGVCELSGGAVSLLGAGTCTIRADQPGEAPYAAAPQAQQSFAVVRTSQTVTFTSSPPAPASAGGSYALTATSSSGLAVAFSVASGSAGVCDLSGSTVTLLATGTCTVLADQPGNAAYEPAPQAQQSFAVARASQTITITSANPSPVDKRSPDYTITATASSGLAVTFSIDPSSVDTCRIAGSTVTFDKKGDCIVYADQAGDANYLPAPQARQTIVVVPNV